jgi:hypothetical protein
MVDQVVSKTTAFVLWGSIPHRSVWSLATVLMEKTEDIRA